jgi:hypothetical protein
MNIKTDGSHEYRLDLVHRVTQRAGKGTGASAIYRSMEGYPQLLDALDRAATHEDMTPELADALSTPRATRRHEIDAEVSLE